jgi:hypothetical protein
MRVFRRSFPSREMVSMVVDAKSSAAATPLKMTGATFCSRVHMCNWSVGERDHMKITRMVTCRPWMR